MNLFEFKLKGTTPEDGIFAISIVKNPAMESRLVKLTKELPPVVAKLSGDEEMVISGSALIPDKMFYRSGEQTGTAEGGYAFFSKETIRDITKLFLKNNKANEVTLDHKEETSGMSLFEVWIVEDDVMDKSRALGFDSSEAPIGTMMLSYQIHDDEIWDRIKNGDLNGYSIEAHIIPIMTIELEKELTTLEECDVLINIIDNLLKK